MKLPCQEIVWDVLPAIRAAVVIELVENGVSQLEAARLLDLAPSAISQYLNRKRGYRIEFEEPVKASIRHLARDLKAGAETDVVGRICEICKQLRDEDEKCGTSGA
jgi:predicted transcriptional regulator